MNDTNYYSQMNYIIFDLQISSLRSNKIRRSNSWRSLKERGNHSITSRAYSVDELHRNHKQFQKSRRRDCIFFPSFFFVHIISILASHSPIKNLSYSHRKCSNDVPSHTRFDRLSSTLVNYSNPKKQSLHRKQFDQPIFSTLSHHSGGGDSGYSEESFATKSCPHCHCQQRSSFHNYRKLLNKNSSTDSSPSDIRKSSDNLLSSRSYSYIPPIEKSQQKVIRTLTEKRRRNLSCDASIWSRPQTQKPIIIVRQYSHI